MDTENTKSSSLRVQVKFRMRHAEISKASITRAESSDSRSAAAPKSSRASVLIPISCR